MNPDEIANGSWKSADGMITDAGGRMVADFVPFGHEARLIAAAPDMLAALKRALPGAWILATSGNTDAVAIHAEIRDAIAKAEGRS